MNEESMINDLGELTMTLCTPKVMVVRIIGKFKMPIIANYNSSVDNTILMCSIVE